ncbi:MAG: hypothetical protein ACREJC_09875 [Tepidisphaeraceae bacterium]
MARRRNPAGLISRHVQAILYVHNDNAKDYVHVFADREPEMKTDAQGRQWLRVDALPIITNVKMAAMNGSLVLTHTRGKTLSEDL